MPVTKTAKRALRSSKKKQQVNKLIMGRLNVAYRIAKKTKAKEKITTAVSLADRAAKKNVIHRNKASRIKTALAKLTPAKKSSKAKRNKK